MNAYRKAMMDRIDELTDAEFQDVRVPPYHWTPFKAGVLGLTLGTVITILTLVSYETETTVPQRMRLNEPCHYGAKPMMVEDGNSAGKHRVVCGCP